MSHNRRLYNMLLIITTSLFFLLINVSLSACVFMSCRLNNLSSRLPSPRDQSINTNDFLGNQELVFAHHPRFTCNLSFLSQRGGAIHTHTHTQTHTHTHKHTHQNRNSLAWNINFARKRHRESETSSNLMQEKSHLARVCEFKEERGLPSLPLSLPLSLSLYIYPFFPPLVNADH